VQFFPSHLALATKRVLIKPEPHTYRPFRETLKSLYHSLKTYLDLSCTEQSKENQQ